MRSLLIIFTLFSLFYAGCKSDPKEQNEETTADTTSAVSEDPQKVLKMPEEPVQEDTASAKPAVINKDDLKGLWLPDPKNKDAQAFYLSTDGIIKFGETTPAEDGKWTYQSPGTLTMITSSNSGESYPLKYKIIKLDANTLKIALTKDITETYHKSGATINPKPSKFFTQVNGNLEEKTGEYHFKIDKPVFVNIAFRENNAQMTFEINKGGTGITNEPTQNWTGLLYKKGDYTVKVYAGKKSKLPQAFSLLILQ